MKRTVQMSGSKRKKTRSMYTVQQLANDPIRRWFPGVGHRWVDDTTWVSSIFRFDSKEQATIKMVELRLNDAHGNQYRVHRVRVRTP